MVEGVDVPVRDGRVLRAEGGLEQPTRARAGEQLDLLEFAHRLHGYKFTTRWVCRPARARG